MGEPPGGPLLGVVTVLFGGDEAVEGFLRAVAAQGDVSVRVYLVDNNPSPAPGERFRTLAASLGVDAHLARTGGNVGVARGNNLGIGLALRDGCSRVLLANNDTTFPAGTFRRLLDSVDGGELAVTPKLLCPGPDRPIWFVSGVPDAWISPTRHVGMGEPDRGQFDGVTRTEFAPTTFLMLDASVFERVGLMDEAFFAYYDDTDFVRRMRDRGIGIRCRTDVEVVHLVGASTGGLRSPFTVFYGHRNRVYYMRKHFRGLERLVGLGYFLLSRVPRTVLMPPRLAARMWAGVWAGLRLPVPPR